MIHIHSVNGYMRLRSWVLGNILQLGTQSFCRRFLDYKIDPCGRLRDQMEMAARTVPANIAEGSSRHQTSYESELRLLDVARASVSELEGDYLNWLMRFGQKAWSVDDSRYKTILSIQLEDPHYSQDLLVDVSSHILQQYSLFAPHIEEESHIAAASALLVLCERVKQLLTGQINKRLADFKDTGGFAENMTKERLVAIKEQAQQTNAPRCPVCGAEMRKMTAKRGANAGNEFWSCTNYPNCKGTAKV